MKKSILLFFLILLVSIKLNGQGKIDLAPYTPNGIFDTVYDQFGKKYAIRDLQIDFGSKSSTAPSPGKPISQGNTTFAGPTTSCQAGYFRLYFAGGLTANTTLANNIKSVYCQLYTDISCFITSPLSSPCNPTQNNNTFVNLYINDNAVAPALGSFATLYGFPLNPASPNPGITEDFVHKTIVSGFDAYTNMVSPMINYVGANNFYHGIISVNPNANWNFNTSMPINTIPASQRDFYTVALHEALHGLGFGSLISPAGGSMFGPTNNYYSMYDTHLRDYLGNKIVSNNNNPCTWFGHQVNASNVSSLNGLFCSPPLDITQNCAQAPRYVSNIDVKLYHPNCFEVGSSLSHFEDMCSPTVNAANNNLYFVMSNAYGAVKRFPKDEERTVLCDLGYAVAGSYNSPVAGSYHAYPAGPCPGTNIWGINDGLNGTGFSFVPNFNANTAINIPKSIIMQNDAPSTIDITCVSFVYPMPGISLNVNAGSVILQLAAGPQQSCGPVLLQYLPKNAAGQLGNPTYIYAYFPCIGTCQPNLCDMIQNGGFESLNPAFGNNCGGFSTLAIDCWEPYTPTPDITTRFCQGINGAGINQLAPGGISPVPDSWSGAPNDKFVGMWGASRPGGNFNTTTSECVKTTLAMPLIPSASYVVSFWVYKGPIGSGPLVISFATAPTNAAYNGGGGPSFPQNLTTLASFQVNTSTNNQWAHFSQTVVFNGTSNHNCVAIGCDEVLTAIANGQPEAIYFWIDDVSITPAGQTPVFNMPATLCGGNSFTNLAQYVNQSGTFSGTGVTNNGGVYAFNANNSLAPGIYPIIFTYVTPAGCVKTLVQQVTILGGMTLTATGPSLFCGNLYPSVSLSANNSLGATVSYNWQPGNLPGQAVTVSPTSSTIYTVSAVDPNNGCTVSAVFNLNVSTSCCPQTVQSNFNTLSSNLIPTGTTLSGQVIINQNTTLGNGNGVVNFYNGEFLIAPGVVLTVPPGVVFQAYGAHLYGCSTAMWQGIVLQNGAQMRSNIGQSNTTLIEDAIVALDIDNNTGIINPLLEIWNTIFNKNYTSIRVRNSSLVNFGLIVKSCVFTSRTLPFTPTLWPSTSDIGAGLRAAVNPTTGLIAPYILPSLTPAFLKSPYNTQPAHIGVEINNVGNIAGANPSNGVEFGFPSQGAANMFNLFDGLGIGIDVTDASLTTMNNVFQNMKYYSTPNGMFGGKGIRHTVNTGSLMNARLNLAPWGGTMYQNTSFGNRFWDCYSGVETSNVYDVNIEYGIIRSTHALNNNPPVYSPGAMGIYLVSNRFNYNVKFSEFNNIAYGIWSNFTSGQYNVGGSNMNGTYASNIYINQNYFGQQVNSTLVGTTEYLSDAIHLNAPSANGWQIMGNGFIQSNRINRAYRGINVNGMSGYNVNIGGNLIELEDDNTTGQLQYGIKGLNTQSGLFIQSNVLTATGPFNQRITLIHCANNGRPSVECNDLSNSYQAFEFEGQNPNTSWAGNTMLNHERGLVLSNNGVIGQQGFPGAPIDNQWNGAWIAPSFETFVIGSTAPASPLFVQPGPPFEPLNNGAAGGTAYNGGCVNLTMGNSFPCKILNLPPPPAWKTNQGTITGSALSNEAEQSKIELFPNPNSGNLTVAGLRNNENATIKITDVTGKNVYYQNISGATSNNINISTLANGIYVVEIQNGNTRTTRKLVLAK